MRFLFLNSAVIANSKMDYSKLVRENDGRIKTKDNSNKFNFMVKYTDRSDYKSWQHFAGFISNWICENPVNKHFVIYLNFLCLGLVILCCLFYAAPFLDFIVVRGFVWKWL